MIPVSIIVPNYNHADYLEQRMESILSQTYTNFELIILDDCSTDESRKIIEKYRGHNKISHIIYNDANSGSSFRQWQKGLALARGEFVWIAESDDYCEHTLLEILLNAINKKDKNVLAYCKSIRVNNRNEFMDDLSFWYKDLSEQRWKKSYSGNGKKEIEKFLAYKNTIPNASAVLFRRTVAVDAMNGIGDFRLAGDWFFWIKLLQLGQLTYTVETTNYFRTHDRAVRMKEQASGIADKEKLRIIDYLISNKLVPEKQFRKKGMSFPSLDIVKNIFRR